MLSNADRMSASDYAETESQLVEIQEQSQYSNWFVVFDWNGSEIVSMKVVYCMYSKCFLRQSESEYRAEPDAICVDMAF